MSKPVAIPNNFAAQVGPIPLSQLDANFTALQTALNDPLTYENALTDSGSVNVYAATWSGITPAYVDGLRIRLKITTTNTGASTFNLASLGAKSITLQDGSALTGGELLAGAVYELQYDGTKFQLMGVLNTYGKTAAESAASVTPTNYSIVNDYTGLIVPDRFTTNTSPGTTDMTFAMQSALAVLRQNGFGEIKLLGKTYLVTDTAFNLLSTDIRVKITGIPLRSVILNKAAANKPTIKFTDSQYHDIGGLVLIGAATFPNYGIEYKSAGGQRCGFIQLHDILCQTNGGGIHIQSTNTIDIENYQYWPSGGPALGATIDANGQPFAILADGSDAVNSVNLRGTINIGGLNTIANGGCGIKIDGSASAAQFQDWKIEKLECEVGSARSLWVRNGNLCTFNQLFTENAEVRLDNGCYRVAINGLSAGTAGTVVLDGTQAKGGCVQTTFQNSQALSITADSANLQTMHINCAWTGAGGDADASTSKRIFGSQTTGSVSVPDKIGAAGLIVAAGSADTRISVAYGSTMTVQTPQGNLFNIDVTDNRAMTVNIVNAPAANSQLLRIRIRNTSGGAIGVFTFTGIKMNAFTNPAPGKNRVIALDWDPVLSFWYEVYQSTADITN